MMLGKAEIPRIVRRRERERAMAPTSGPEGTLEAAHKEARPVTSHTLIALPGL